MSTDRLLAYYERVADAPDAIPRLRRFILDLAVRGNLVPQDPNDEPASELLKRIAAEKARLVKAGEIRRGKPLPDVEPDEVPYGVPCGWEWARIRDITSDRGQTVPDCDFTYIDVTAINKEVGRIEDARVTSASEAPSRARKIVSKGDVLYSCVRPYLLNIAIVENEMSPTPIASTAFAVLNGSGLVLPRYQWIVLRSPFMISCVDEKMRGQAYPAINDSDFALLPVPLPPLAEQRRIVAKVDELMALCDRLEAARKEREATRDRLTAASLVRLNAPDPDPAVFASHSRFALDNLSALTARTDQIKQFRQTILNLAVQGRLTRTGVAGEGPLIDRGSSAPLAHQSGGSSASPSCSVPPHWNVVPLAKAASLIADCPHSTPKWTTSGKICIRTNQFQAGRLDLENSRFVSEATYLERIQRVRPAHDDILYSREGGILGVACRIPPNVDLCLGQRMMLIRSAKTVRPAFLELVLNSPLITAIARAKTTGGAAPRVNVSTIKVYPIPIPPVSEQEHIVAKVDELMELCDRLEASLAAGEDHRRRLLGALLAEALAPVEMQAAG